MSYIIDGHNLIPKIPGLQLSDPEDEQKLIQILQAFCRRRRKQVEVYFDQAPPGSTGTRKFGMVTAVFVRQGSSADAAIEKRLHRLGRRARSYTVVSSDRQVVSAARSQHAAVMSSTEFARELLPPQSETPGEGEKPAEELGPQEVDEWLGLFRNPPEE
jgi:predicted RNA-binding protein with PIN domain